MRYLLLTSFLYFSFNISAQRPVESYGIKEQYSKFSSYQTTGYQAGGVYDPATTYTLNFGTQEKTPGVDREIFSVTVDNITYNRAPSINGTSFDYVHHRKHPKLAGNIVNALFEGNLSSNNVLNLSPTYANTLDEIINSYVVNRGSDNVFTNLVGTSSNIERLDLLNFNGIIALDVDRQGFLINERNGNDNIQVAAILAVDKNGYPAKYGPLTPISARSWGRTGPEIVTTVVTRDTLRDKFFKPNVNVGTQTISGVFFAFRDLKIEEGQQFYGFSIFPFDVTSEMDLVSLTDVPSDTDGTVNGGADILAGTGYFTNTPINISGSIIDDFNSRNDNKLSGSTIGSLDGSSIFVHLVDKRLNMVIDIFPISKTGTFNFPSVLSSREYTVYISTEITKIGSKPSQTVLPPNWSVSGENFNSLNPEGYDEIFDGKLELNLKDTEVLRIDFGVTRATY